MMKIFYILCVVGLFTTNAYSQKSVPQKMLKGIECKVDEFTDVTTYSSKKACCLTVEDNNGEINMNVLISFFVYDSPRPIKKIHILAGSHRQTIEDDAKFSTIENPVRYMKTPSSGSFGTSSYKPATFDTRMSYKSIFQGNAIDYSEFIEQVIANKGGKIKFECEGGDYIVEIDKAQSENMKRMLDIYKYLSE